MKGSDASCTATLAGHSNYVSSVAFHPSLPLLATGSYDRTAKLWRLSEDGTEGICTGTLGGNEAHGGVTTNHVPLRGACMTRETNWPLSGYDSMYHGKYTLMHDRHQIHKNLYPAFSVCDPHTFSGMTYHKVNMTSVSVDIEEMFKRKKYLKLK